MVWLGYMGDIRHSAYIYHFVISFNHFAYSKTGRKKNVNGTEKIKIMCSPNKCSMKEMNEMDKERKRQQQQQRMESANDRAVVVTFFFFCKNIWVYQGLFQIQIRMSERDPRRYKLYDFTHSGKLSCCCFLFFFFLSIVCLSLTCVLYEHKMHYQRPQRMCVSSKIFFCCCLSIRNVLRKWRIRIWWKLHT